MGKRRGVLTVAMVVFLTALPVTAETSSSVLADNWYALYMQGQKAGHLHEQFRRRGRGEDAVYDSLVRRRLVLRRLNTTVEVVAVTEVREDSDGHLLSFTHELQGAVGMKVRGDREGDQLVIRTTSPRGRETIRRVAAHDGLCPSGYRRLVKKHLAAGSERFEADVFVPDMPEEAAHLSARVRGREFVDLYEIEKNLFRVESTLDVLPGIVATDWMDAGATSWLMKTQLPGGMSLESRKAPRELATAPNDPAELLRQSVVPVDRPIPRARSARKLEIILTTTDAEAAAPSALPSGPHQQVQQTREGLKVTVSKAEVPPQTYQLPYQGEELRPFLRPNAWLEADEPQIREMAQAAVGDATDAADAAGRIERYVGRHITEKNLGVGFATAAETAAQAAGDCTEHAVLAAALARAAGMPARVVGGLVYAEGIFGAGKGGFGYHMWTEVYVGRWLPIDAALGGHDATHLALVRGDLNETRDLFDISVAISRFFGRVRARLLRVEH